MKECKIQIISVSCVFDKDIVKQPLIISQEKMATSIKSKFEIVHDQIVLHPNMIPNVLTLVRKVARTWSPYKIISSKVFNKRK